MISPTAMAAAKYSMSGSRVAMDVMAGPGQRPTSPHPTPNKAAPPSKGKFTFRYGKVRIRARIERHRATHLIIREIPFGTTAGSNTIGSSQ